MKHLHLTVALLIAANLLLAGFALAFEPIRTVDNFFQNIGRSIQRTTRKMTNEQPARKQTSSQSHNKLVCTIQKASIAPDEVKKGTQVTVTLQYVIKGAPTAGMQVTEKSILLAGDKELTVLKDESTTKENGTWENTLTFAVPESATPGTYTVLQELSVQGKTRSSRRSFTVQ